MKNHEYQTLMRKIELYSDTSSIEKQNSEKHFLTQDLKELLECSNIFAAQFMHTLILHNFDQKTGKRKNVEPFKLKDGKEVSLVLVNSARGLYPAAVIKKEQLEEYRISIRDYLNFAPDNRDKNQFPFEEFVEMIRRRNNDTILIEFWNSLFERKIKDINEIKIDTSIVTTLGHRKTKVINLPENHHERKTLLEVVDQNLRELGSMPMRYRSPNKNKQTISPTITR